MPSSGRRIEGFKPIHWRRWGEALGHGASPQNFQGGLVLVTGSDQRLLRAIHSVRGSLDCSTIRWPGSLEQLASDLGCWWALQGSLDDLRSLASMSFLRDEGQDYMARLLELWAALQELQSDGRLFSWPHRLDHWPALVDLAPQGLVSLCPDGHAAVAAIWRGTHLSTALAFSRRRGRIERILGPEVLQPAMGLVSGDWSRDYRYLSVAVERLLGPLGLGFFAQESAVRELSWQGDAAAWARAVAARDVIVSPMSAGLAVPLGLDLGRSLLRRARDLVTNWGGEWVGSAELGGLFESGVRRPDLRDLLGIDAFSLLRDALDVSEEREPELCAPLAGTR